MGGSSRLYWLWGGLSVALCLIASQHAQDRAGEPSHDVASVTRQSAPSSDANSAHVTRTGYPAVPPLASLLQKVERARTLSLDSASSRDVLANNDHVPGSGVGGELTLLGITAWGENRVAFVRIRSVDRVELVRVGESIGAAAVLAIDNEHLTLREGLQDSVIELGSVPAQPKPTARVDQRPPPFDRATTSNDMAVASPTELERNAEALSEINSRISEGASVSNPQ